MHTYNGQSLDVILIIYKDHEKYSSKCKAASYNASFYSTEALQMRFATAAQSSSHNTYIQNSILLQCRQHTTQYR